MNQCKSNQDSKVNKNRMIRLVCVFLQSIIKNKLINLQDVFLDIQSFCIEFSQVKEANAILKTIKSEAAQNSNCNPINNWLDSSLKLT